MRRKFPQIRLPSRRGKPIPPEPQMFGYVRVSTAEQKTKMQRDALLAYGVPEENIYEETVSGSSRRRPAFENLLRAIREGDTVIVWKQDRFGRNALKVIEQIYDFRRRKINFVSLTERFDFSTPMGEFMSGLMALQAQFEVRLTAERTKTGIVSHVAGGGRYGRKVEFDLAKAVQHFKIHRNISAAAKHVGVVYERFNYHVQKTPELLALVQSPRRKKKKNRPKAA